MSSFRTLDDLGDITGKVALVRVDLNLPMQEGRASDVTRVEVVAILPRLLDHLPLLVAHLYRSCMALPCAVARAAPDC